MSNHIISCLADPTDADDAVTRRYVALQFQALSDEIQGNKRKLDAFQNLFGVENNQVSIRMCELLDADFKKLTRLRIYEEGRNIGTSFFCFKSSTRA